MDEHVFRDPQTNYHITASFGVATAKPVTDDNFSKGNFINMADTALYSAKEAGRNRVALFEQKKKWYKF